MNIIRRRNRKGKYTVFGIYNVDQKMFDELTVFKNHGGKIEAQEYNKVFDKLCAIVDGKK